MMIKKKLEKIKILAFDLDDTLLTCDKKLSKRTREALEVCREKGYKVVLATARPVRKVIDFVGEGIYDAVVCHNGAVVIDGGLLLPQSAHIPFDRAQGILLKWIKEFPESQMSLEMNDRLYSNFDASLRWKHERPIMTDFSDVPVHPVEKLIIQVKSSREEQRLRGLLGDDLLGYVMDGDLMFITNSSALKSKGLMALAESWGMSLENVAAFGDGVNDIDMMESCGFSVAMGNACDEVKEHADHIALSNDEDGVAIFLQEHLLGT
ncbi:MAG: HAD family hydrolase [Christensenellales bacterium]|jgi:HAD superfamily hydrolase (TIGR01484 family)